MTVNENHQVTILLVRHGKTLFNENKRAQGWCDAPLTDEGSQVVKQLGRGLAGYPLDAVYTSTSGRTKETAEIILENSNHSDLPQKHLASLRELFFGNYEGEHQSVLKNDMATDIGLHSREDFMWANFSIKEIVDSIDRINQGAGETWENYKTRLFNGLNVIVEEALQNSYKEVLVVSHNMSINAILYEIQKNDKVLDIANASVSKIVYKNGTFHVESVNDTSFIEKGKLAVEL